MAKELWQIVSLRPLTGILDSRSSADEKPAGSFAWKEAFAIDKDGKLSRAKGFIRAFGPSFALCPYSKNWDFHLQGVNLPDREPITMLFASTSNQGARRLFLGTKTRLQVLNESTGQYTSIGSGFGAGGAQGLTQTRFNAAELQNKVFFTNDADKPQYHVLGSSTVSEIPTLSGAASPTLKISKARRVVSWNGQIFFLNVVEDGVHRPSRIWWSDLNNGINFDLGDAAAITDFQDLDYGEVILNAIPLQGALYVFTDKSIWRCVPAIDTGPPPSMTLSCVKVYTEPRNQSKCLVYPNTLVSTGFELWYLGRDGWYEFDAYKTEPERPEWLHRSTSVIFSDAATLIDKRSCESPVAEYRPETNELHLSWPIFDPLAQPTNPDSEVNCDAPGLPPAVGTGLNKFTLVANLKYKTADLRRYGMTAYTNFRSDIATEGDCNQTVLFLGASGQDWALKQIGVGDAMHLYNADGEIELIGYNSILRGIFPFEKFSNDKVIRSFLADIVADTSDDKAVVRLKIGTSATAIDPNRNGACSIIWHQLSDKAIKCYFTRSPAAYVTNNVRPDSTNTFWAFLYQGRFVSYELTITNPDHTPATSGASTISRFEVSARLLA